MKLTHFLVNIINIKTNIKYKIKYKIILCSVGTNI